MIYEELISPALWAVAICVTGGFVVRAWRKSRKENARFGFKAPLLALLSIVLVVPAIGIVPPGHRGVVYNANGGVSTAERGEGFTLLVPWVQHMTNLSVRTQKLYSSKVFAQSLDLQEITVVASVNYHVEPSRAAELYRGIGLAYKDTVIQPALFQRTKAAIGLVRAEDFAKNRGPLAATIQEQITEQLSDYGIVVEYVNVEDAIFDPAFVQAVKDKVIAEQFAAEQERLIAAQAAIKEQTIINAEATARAIFIEAQAQADANVLLAKSLSPELLRWKWLVQWDGILPSTLVGGQDATILLDGRGY